MRRVVGFVSVVLLGALLSGCTAGATPATAPASPVALLPTAWHVHDAEGADPATYLLFSLHDAEVLEPDGYIVTDWVTQGDEMLATVTTWSNTLHRSTAPSVPWLTGATRVARSGSGYALLDAAGRTLATLRDDGPAPTRNDTITTPWPTNSEDGPDFAPAVGAPGTGTLPAGALVGRWAVASQGPTPATLTFRPDGTWSSAAADACGPSAALRPKGVGAYRVLPGGFLLHTDTSFSTLDLCVRPGTRPADVAAVSDFFEARSVRVDGDRLTLFDQAGQRIGTLTKVG